MGRDHSEALHIYGRIISELLRKRDGKVWTEFIRYKIGTVAGPSYEPNNESPGSKEGGESDYLNDYCLLQKMLHGVTSVLLIRRITEIKVSNQFTFYLNIPKIIKSYKYSMTIFF
jgi:hypothetical protein